MGGRQGNAGPSKASWVHNMHATTCACGKETRHGEGLGPTWRQAWRELCASNTRNVQRFVTPSTVCKKKRSRVLQSRMHSILRVQTATSPPVFQNGSSSIPCHRSSSPTASKSPNPVRMVSGAVLFLSSAAVTLVSSASLGVLVSGSQPQAATLAKRGSS